MTIKLIIIFALAYILNLESYISFSGTIVKSSIYLVTAICCNTVQKSQKERIMISPKTNPHTSPSTLIYLHLFVSTLPCSHLPSSTPPSPATSQSTSSDERSAITSKPPSRGRTRPVSLIHISAAGRCPLVPLHHQLATTQVLVAGSCPSPAGELTEVGKAQAWRKTRCILPQFSLMKSPLPPPLLTDPLEEDEDERREGRGRGGRAGEGRQPRKL